jgi:hypothetical protein
VRTTTPGAGEVSVAPGDVAVCALAGFTTAVIAAAVNPRLNAVDGVPRSYRDRKDLALQSAQILKARNPNSVVKLKDLQTGEEIVIAFESRQQ